MISLTNRSLSDVLLSGHSILPFTWSSCEKNLTMHTPCPPPPRVVSQADVQISLKSNPPCILCVSCIIQHPLLPRPPAFSQVQATLMDFANIPEFSLLHGGNWAAPILESIWWCLFYPWQGAAWCCGEEWAFWCQTPWIWILTPSLTSSTTFDKFI